MTTRTRAMMTPAKVAYALADATTFPDVLRLLSKYVPLSELKTAQDFRQWLLDIADNLES